MRLRLNIGGLILAAAVPVPLVMIVAPPLLNAHSTGSNLAGLWLVACWIPYWVFLLVKGLKLMLLKQEVKRLFHNERK